MKDLCRSCRRHWDGKDEVDMVCIATQSAMHICGLGVTQCRKYASMAVAEREDDGTMRCSVCGKLVHGENECPECGAWF